MTTSSFRGDAVRRWLAAAVLSAVVPLLLFGCAQAGSDNAAAPPSVEAIRVADAAPAEANEAPARDGAGGETAAPVERKIIYTATVALVVKDFPETDRQIKALTEEFGGFITEFREDHTYGDRQAGRWVVRTPVKRFQEFLDKVVALGVPETRQVDAQDVTEEYIDLGARISNKHKLEERILELLAKQTGEIKDVIAVETELARVREEIERMEGRQRYLANRAELTTITISAREDIDYVPPQAPTFASKVDSVWSQSLAALRRTGEGLALFVVAIVPWLVVLAILFAPFLIWAARAWFRRRRSIVRAEAI